MTRARGPWARRLLRAAVVVALLIGFQVVATYVLEIYGGNAESVWYEYRQALDDPVDTLVIGSSVAEYAFDPAPLEQELGAVPQCLSTPAQSLRCTLAGVRRALADHDIRRVIVGTSYNTLIEETSYHSDAVFTQYSLIGRPLPEQVAGYANLILRYGHVDGIASFGFLLPWTMSHVKFNPSDVMDNIRNRLECATPMEAQVRVDPRYHSLGRGFASYEEELDVTTYPHGSISANYHYDIALNDDQVANLEELCAYCEEQNVELVVAVMPRPGFATLAYPDGIYPRDMAEIQALVERHGAVFLDFSLAHSEYYAPLESDFIDDVHLNLAGAARFSQTFAETLAAIERGEDVSARFWRYDQWDDCRAQYGPLEYVWFDHARAEGELTLMAGAYGGTEDEVEWEYAVRQPETEGWTVVRHYDREPTCVIDLGEQGVGPYGELELRLRARRVGEAEPDTEHIETVACYG